MNRKTLMLGTAALVACASSQSTPTTSTSAPAAASSMMGTTYTANLLPTNASGNRIAGKIRLLPTARTDEMMAEIEIRGGAYQNKYAWAVRQGRCGEQGQELGTSMSYRVIETRGDGMAEVKMPVRISVPSGTVYHVAIFPSATNRTQVVSCGVLSPE